MNKKIAEILSEYKLQESEHMDNLIFILDEKNDAIRNALIAWKNIKVKLDDVANAEDMQDDWEYIWQFCRYDLKEFMNMTGLDTGDANKMICKLKNLRLIYPDGTINSNAGKVIRSIIKKRLEKQTGKKANDGE